MKRKCGRKAAIMMAVLMVASACMAGCGKTTEGNGAQTEQSEQTKESAPDVTESTESVSEPEESSQETPPESKEPEVPAEEFVSDRSEVFELLSGMNVGWILGNTLDAHGAGNSLSAETYWGNPKTTKEMIDTVAAQGFNTIRIPVTWAEHVGTAPDYQINEAWMDRVEEIVNYAVDNDMYVIMDTHHEPDFWLKPKADGLEDVKAELAAIWTQVAQRFQDYDNKLLFEGMNEPRIKGSANEWNGGTPEERVIVDELNQVFIDAVRATGGNNAERCLIICTYGNSANYNTLKELRIPADNHIAVAVHMYTPYVFTYEAPEGNLTTWDGSKKKDLVATLKLIDRYLIKEDVPVIVTEFGAVNKDNTEEVLKWLADYMSAMNSFNIKCCWWDNNLYTSNGENFGIFDRRNLTWFSQEVADALIANAAAQ